MILLASLAFFCSVVPAILYARNVRLYRRPSLPDGPLPAISILIPARNEEKSIGAAIEAALQSTLVEFEIVVLDDHSEDRTTAIVQEYAARDSRVRLVESPSLPLDWCGKQHACYVLSKAARHPVFCFIDADVRLAPDGLARMVGFMESSKADLVSGIPHQGTGTFLEQLLIPLIHFLLLGFLPFGSMRRSNRASFAAGCGQLFVIRREAYEKSGGHEQVKSSLHDGLTLPRAFRCRGFRTDLCDATEVASCRMYRSASEVWFGLAKNAREGLAAGKLIVPMTLVLLLGQVLPLFLLVVFLILFSLEMALGPNSIGELMSGYEYVHGGAGLVLSLFAIAAMYYPRLDAARRFRQPLIGALLHPVGIVVLLTIQWYAFLFRGRSWKGRRYG